MAFDVDGQLEQLFGAQGLAHQSIGTQQAGHDGRGAAAQAPGWGHGQPHPRLEGNRLQARLAPDPLGRAVDKVVGAATQMGAFGALDDQIEALAAALDAAHLEDVVEIEGGPKAIKAWAQIGCGGGYMHRHPLPDAGASHGVTSARASVSAEQHAGPAGGAV